VQGLDKRKSIRSAAHHNTFGTFRVSINFKL
jgi:hypothetical protein